MMSKSVQLSNNVATSSSYNSYNNNSNYNTSNTIRQSSITNNNNILSKTQQSRNLTNEYLILRESYRSNKSRLKLNFIEIEQDEVIPDWMECINEINEILKNIKLKMSELSKLYSSRLKVIFNSSDKERDKYIESLTSNITEMFKQCQSKLKRISIPDHNKKLSETDKSIRLNAMRTMGTKIQDLSRNFRSMQKQFVKQLQGQAEAGAQFYGLDEKDNESETMSLVQHKMLIPDRSEDIQKIVKSINDLASLFNELSVLVVEQGSILDRIDYNVEETINSMKTGLNDLDKAESYQKASYSTYCIAILLVVIVILTFMLLLKYI